MRSSSKYLHQPIVLFQLCLTLWLCHYCSPSNSLDALSWAPLHRRENAGLPNVTHLVTVLIPAAQPVTHLTELQAGAAFSPPDTKSCCGTWQETRPLLDPSKEGAAKAAVVVVGGWLAQGQKVRGTQNYPQASASILSPCWSTGPPAHIFLRPSVPFNLFQDQHKGPSVPSGMGFPGGLYGNFSNRTVFSLSNAWVLEG